MRKSEVRSLCAQAIAAKIPTIAEHESKQILKSYGVTVPEGRLATGVDEALQIADEVGYPVVAKAVAAGLLHKTEQQAVHLNLDTPQALRNSRQEIEQHFSSQKLSLDGILVEKMISGDAEFIIGLQNDPHFGPVIMLGTGGTLIHLFNDVTFRPLPVTAEDIKSMLADLRGRKLIEGFRGRAALNAEALVDAAMAIAQLGVDAAGLYESMDFNPLLLTEQAAVAVDAKIILDEQAAEPELEADQANVNHLNMFFEPQKVAVIGASTTPGKIGYVVADSLINHKYQGKVYPITRGGKEIFGLKSYAALSELPAKIDLAVVVVGLKLVPQLLEECHALGIPAMLIISGGGKELGGEQMVLEQEIQDKSRALGVRVIGPNCIGCFSAKNRFDAFFQTHERLERPKPGRVAFMTQSGTYGCSFLEAFEGVGISKMISYGNRVDVDEADLVAYLAADDETDVMALYIEGLSDGRKLMQTAKSVIAQHQKPIVAYKSGRTLRSAKAAQSHTGAYGGAYGVYQGAFEQAGIIAVDSYEELEAAAKALAMQPPAQGPAISMISNGAGPMVNAIDLFDRYQLEIASLRSASIGKMEAHYPAFYICKNPVDVTGSASSSDYHFAMECLLDDPGVDVIMNWFVFQDTPLDEGIVASLDELNRKSSKPILCGAVGGRYTRKMSQAIEEIGVPVFKSAHLWIAAAKAVIQWGRIRQRI
jgi:3-hydroxypropionyl-CoA synthetase (ADP-forming)